MNAVRVYLVVHVILSSCVLVNCFKPFKSTSEFISGLWETMFISPERCDSQWISFNAADLEYDLESRLFGQHIASEIILKAVSGFMNNNNPQKPLVLSLHGLSGTGKNFVSKIIAENIYKEGMDSNFVHFFTPSYHFPRTAKIDTYKSRLQQWIKGNVTNCPRSMFIFDEMDKMHPGLIDSIKPYLDHYYKLDGVSYRKAIFIFLSNTGGESITQTALDFLKKKQRREEIELKDLEESLSDMSWKDKNGGLWHSALIDNNLVDFFVPFLPLERQQVIQCIVAKIVSRRLRLGKKMAEVVVNITNDLVNFPKIERVFSSSGCKTIDNRLNFYTPD